jgi:membrane-bound serine protease (ClpP class)
VLLVLAVILLLILPEPWAWIAFLVTAVLGIGELFLWNRTTRRYRRAVGPETLIGREAVVVTECRPDGQVRIDGEIWAARCEDGASPGETVRVLGRNRLRLQVARVQ